MNYRQNKRTRVYQRSCACKIRYTKRKAEIVVEEMGNRGIDVGIYPCPFCQGWHVGKRGIYEKLESGLLCRTWKQFPISEKISGK